MAYPAAPQWSTQPGPTTADGAAAPPEGWQAAYEKSHRQSRIFMATTAVAGVLALGLGAWGVAQAASTDVGTSAVSQTIPGGGLGQGGQGPGGLGQGGLGQGGLGQGAPGGGQGMGAPGQGGPGIGGLADTFFNSDGSLNQTQVDQLKQMLTTGNGPTLAGFKQILTHAVSDGDITQAQADKLLAALGSASGGGTGQSVAPSTGTSTTSA